MIKFQWLPRGFELNNNDFVKSIAAQGEDWQIITTMKEGVALVAKTELFCKWCSALNFEGAMFYSVQQDNNEYMVFASSAKYMISSVELGPYPKDDLQASAFAEAYRRFRRKYPEIPLQDALFIEEMSLLLPTFTSDTKTEDKTVLGKWLTGGINISLDNATRISEVVSWLPQYRLEEIAAKAGLTVNMGSAAGMQRTAYQNVTTTHTSGEKKSHAIISTDQKFILVGRPELEKFFNDYIVDVVRNENKYAKMGIGFPGATVLYGKPGSGKTYAVERLAEYLGWPCYSIDASSIGSKYIHETSQKISDVFHQAICSAPAVLIIDEMEAFLSERTESSWLSHIEEMSEFLRLIPKAIKSKVLIFGMTNMINLIDSAILRKGRFDNVIEVQMPTQQEVEALLIHLFKDLPVAEDINYSRIANLLAGRPFSDVTYCVKEAGRLAVRANKEYIDMQCLKGATESLDLEKQQNKPMGFQ